MNNNSNNNNNEAVQPTRPGSAPHFQESNPMRCAPTKPGGAPHFRVCATQTKKYKNIFFMFFLKI